MTPSFHQKVRIECANLIHHDDKRCMELLDEKVEIIFVTRLKEFPLDLKLHFGKKYADSLTHLRSKLSEARSVQSNTHHSTGNF